MSHQHNIVRLKAIARALSGLEENVVYVGGATVSLYITNPAAPEVRPTDDIDVVIELISYNHFGQVEDKLRELGFQNDVQSNVITRYRYQGIIVDIMPTNPEVVGFSNIWYQEGVANSMDYRLDDEQVIRIFSSPYFIASKLEAFKSRGGSDMRTSPDFEDIVHVLDNRTEIETEILNSPNTVKQYLVNEFSELLENENINEGISCHLEPEIAAVRLERMKQIMQRIIES